jgi:hypothetical protein
MKGAVQGLATTTASTPVKKLPRRAALIGEVAAQVHEAAAELDDAAQAQAEDTKQIGEGDDNPRRLQLEAPADGLAGTAQAR